MKRLRIAHCFAAASILTCLAMSPGFRSRAARAKWRESSSGALYNIRDYGAMGDGKTLDTAAINRTIDAAAAAGGGTVLFPAGSYLSVSIHLQSRIALYLDQGANLIAAEPSATAKYDPPEPNQWDAYQDFG